MKHTLGLICQLITLALLPSIIIFQFLNNLMNDGNDKQNHF